MATPTVALNPASPLVASLRREIDNRNKLPATPQRATVGPSRPIDTGAPALILVAGIDRSLVTKKDLIGRIALEARLTRAQAARALESLVMGIQSSLVRGDRVTIAGFGTFGVLQRKARRVRNPTNGRAMEIAAQRVPRFAPGVVLKSAIARRKAAEQPGRQEPGSPA